MPRTVKFLRWGLGLISKYAALLPDAPVKEEGISFYEYYKKRVWIHSSSIIKAQANLCGMLGSKLILTFHHRGSHNLADKRRQLWRQL